MLKHLFKNFVFQKRDLWHKFKMKLIHIILSINPNVTNKVKKISKKKFN